MPLAPPGGNHAQWRDPTTATWVEAEGGGTGAGAADGSYFLSVGAQQHCQVRRPRQLRSSCQLGSAAGACCPCREPAASLPAQGPVYRTSPLRSAAHAPAPCAASCCRRRAVRLSTRQALPLIPGRTAVSCSPLGRSPMVPAAAHAHNQTGSCPLGASRRGRQLPGAHIGPACMHAAAAAHHLPTPNPSHWAVAAWQAGGTCWQALPSAGSLPSSCRQPGVAPPAAAAVVWLQEGEDLATCPASSQFGDCAVWECPDWFPLRGTDISVFKYSDQVGRPGRPPNTLCLHHHGCCPRRHRTGQGARPSSALASLRRVALTPPRRCPGAGRLARTGTCSATSPWASRRGRGSRRRRPAPPRPRPRSSPTPWGAPRTGRGCWTTARSTPPRPSAPRTAGRCGGAGRTSRRWGAQRCAATAPASQRRW